MTLYDFLLWALLLLIVVPFLLSMYIWFAVRTFLIAKRSVERENKDGGR